MEIIEETIRYIDALHHQLAARIQPAQQQQQQQHQQQQHHQQQQQQQHQQEVPETSTAQDQSCE